MENLIEEHKRLIDDLGDVYQRNIYDSLESEFRIVGVVGSRGIGKTTYLLNYLKNNFRNSDKALYVSADHLYFTQHTLIDLATEFIDHYDGELLCIDEIHKYTNWSQELKNIYDLHHKKLKIIFSGSSSIDIIKEKYDLSRRATLKHLPGFSFREYLEVTLEKEFPILSLHDIMNGESKSCDQITSQPRLLGLFNDYLKTGYYPLSLEFKNDTDVYSALMGVVEKTIYIDIASYYQIKTATLPLFKKILQFVYSSPPSSINVNKLAKSLGKDHSDVARYIEMLRDSGLLRFLLIDKMGHALIRNAEKIYLNNTNLFYAVENEMHKDVNKGSVRELFALTMLDSAHYVTNYSQMGDLVCDDMTFEIGGKNKTTKQIQSVKKGFLLCDDILYGDKKSIPLYRLGFLY